MRPQIPHSRSNQNSIRKKHWEGKNKEMKIESLFVITSTALSQLSIISTSNVEVRKQNTNVERTVYGRFWYLLVLWVTIGIGVPGCCGFFLNYGPSNLPIQLLQSSQMSAGPNSALGGRPPKNICHDERLKSVGTFILVDLQSTSMQKYLPTARA